MLNGSTQYATLLRRELCARSASYAALHQLSHVTSYGEVPVVVYQPSPCGTKHGNFIPASYRALLRRPQRSLLVVLFAITVSLAARADSFGFPVGSGSLTYPPYAPPPKVVAPSFSASLGSGMSIHGVLPSWLNIPDTGGNSFSIVQNGVTIFKVVFTSDTVVRTSAFGSNFFQVDATIKGYFGTIGHPGQGVLVFESTRINQNNLFSRNPGAKNGGAYCNTGIAGGFLEMVTTPEPSTLGLLGTGLIGLAAAVRRRKRIVRPC